MEGILESMAKITTLGNANEPMMELSETYLVVINTTIKTAREINAAVGFSANTIPKSVATPLPPLKPTYTGNTCPIKAATAKANSRFTNCSEAAG